MTRADFVAAIIRDPSDDVLRLVFADWLEEHGDPGTWPLRGPGHWVVRRWPREDRLDMIWRWKVDGGPWGDEIVVGSVTADAPPLPPCSTCSGRMTPTRYAGDGHEDVWQCGGCAYMSRRKRETAHA